MKNFSKIVARDFIFSRSRDLPLEGQKRHDERKNTDYGNVNVDPERIPQNIHFKDPREES